MQNGQNGRKKRPKYGGRKPGSLNRVTIEAREACALLVDDLEYRRKLLADFRERRIAPAIEQMLWYYAKGKPKETIEHTGLDGGPISISQIERIILDERRPDERRRSKD